VASTINQIGITSCKLTVYKSMVHYHKTQ